LDLETNAGFMEVQVLRIPKNLIFQRAEVGDGRRTEQGLDGVFKVGWFGRM